MAHVRGHSRTQYTMFPEALDELIAADCPVRVVDAFVDSLDLAQLGFTKVVPAKTGRPAYDPADLLKLYLYGYLNRVRSSRRLERECQRNVEVLWLMNRLAPDHKTIADFRRDHPDGLQGVFRVFTRFCREQALFGDELVAVDGSKFRASASRKKAYTPKRLARELARLDARIAAYVKTLDESDVADEARERSAPAGDTGKALEVLQRQREELQALAGQMSDTGAKQHVTTDPDAKLMRQGNGSGHAVSYNVQTAVDARHKLIVAHEVTDEGNDHRQLAPMAKAAKEVLGTDSLTVVADAGYQNGEHGAQCEAAGITAVVPSQRPVNPRGKELFDKSRFIFEHEHDGYRCPAGELLTLYKTDNRKRKRFYATKACKDCPLKAQCTRAGRRSITRHFDAGHVEAMNARARARPELMVQRRCLVEHPFGTLKLMSDGGRLLLRGMTKVKGEVALGALSYNLLRVTNILGVERLCARLAGQATAG